MRADRSNTPTLKDDDEIAPLPIPVDSMETSTVPTLSDNAEIAHTIESPTSVELMDTSTAPIVTKNSAGQYKCDCGYNAGHRKNRLTNHQKKHCSKRQKSVRTDIPCPICNKEYTYDGLKSHLLPFTKTRKSQTYNAAHESRNADEHKLVLQNVKATYGPKKQQKCC